MIVPERNASFPCQKNMRTKPWENNSQCFSNAIMKTIFEGWGGGGKKFYLSDEQDFLEAKNWKFWDF